MGGRWSTAAVLEKEKVAHAVYNSVINQPDIIAFRKRKVQRRMKKVHEMRQKLDAQRKKILRPAIIASIAEGNAPTAIAQKLRLSQNTVKAVITDPAFNRALSAYQNETLAKARDILIEATEEASETLRTAMRKKGKIDKIQLASAESILTRCNVEMPKVTQTVMRQYSPEETESILKTLKEATAIMETVAVGKSPYLLETAKRDQPKAPSAPVTQPS